MMMGKPEENPISPPQKSSAKTTDKPVVEFKDVSVYRHKQKQPLLDQASFTLHPGEILGFTGVGGNGLGILEAVLGGFLHPAAGSIHHNGADISRLNIRELRAQGLAYVPTDRLHVGSSITATVKENMLIHRRNELSKYLFLDKNAIGDFSGNLTAEYNILGDIEGTASALSGGNLQKLVLAREIDISRDYIIFCEPTWSLDIASGNFIWRQIIKQKGRGAGIILISTNHDEITALSDRIMVMYRGRISGEFANDGSTNLRKELGQVMQGLQINAK
jgi:simple sugar transport system ATP-binding protein